MMCISSLSRRKVLVLAASGAAVSCLAGRASGNTPRPVVVELFTSQGCSSCPPADAFLQDLLGGKGVIALTYHVDYWDYLGWRDTLGSAENSQRQYDYARTRGDMDVYTPQMIVNGGKHFVGSDRHAVLGAIERSRAEPPLPVALALTETKMELVVDIGASAAAMDATLWLMPMVPRISVKILKGEIAGQEITYRNIVRATLPAGMWSGEAKTLKLPKDGVLTRESKGCIALLQKGKVGPVLGAASWGETGA